MKVAPYIIVVKNRSREKHLYKELSRVTSKIIYFSKKLKRSVGKYILLMVVGNSQWWLFSLLLQQKNKWEILRTWSRKTKRTYKTF